MAIEVSHTVDDNTSTQWYVDIRIRKLERAILVLEHRLSAPKSIYMYTYHDLTFNNAPSKYNCSVQLHILSYWRLFRNSDKMNGQMVKLS